MTSIHQPQQITNLLLNKAPVPKRTAEGNKQQARGSKGSQSFQDLLDKPKNEHKSITQKGNDGFNSNTRGQGGKQQNNQGNTSVRGGIGSVTPNIKTINGTENNDVLMGTSKNDYINGRGGNDLIFGGKGKDTLIGREGDDFIFGGKGNDLIYGGKGDDALFGGKGDDFIFGGKGNDFLFGGRGNDWLIGGQGNDRLYGGAGNDILRDNVGGNNYINGGKGTDTLELNKGIDSYDISINDRGEFVIENKQNDQLYDAFDKGQDRIIKNSGELPDTPFKNTVKNVEFFQFGETRISASELRDRVNNPPQDLPLTETQKAALESVFNIDNASVNDDNADGKISEGDTVSGTLFRETGTIDVSYVVSKDNADHINGALGSDLSLSPEVLQQVDHVVNGQQQPFPLAPASVLTETVYGVFPSETVDGVLDTDNSGGLSVGDIVYSRSNQLTTGGDPIGGSPAYHRLTEDDIQKINIAPPPEPLVLTVDQDSAIRERFDIGSGSSYRVLDKDDDGTLGVGDELEITIGGDAIQTIKLTAEDVEAINDKPYPQELNLSDKQHEAIGARFKHLPPPNVADGITTEYTGTAIDKNNDGKLNEGDIVKLKQTGGFGGFNQIVDHVLTAEDIAAIEQDRSNPALDISKGLSSDQKQGLYNAIYGNDIAFTSAPGINSVFDHNSDGKLSVGDTLTISQFDETTGATSLFFHTLTQDELDRYIEGSNNNALSELINNQQKWENSGIEKQGYSFRLDRSAFAVPESIRPTISNVSPDGSVNDLFADTLEPVPDNYSHANATVDTLFEIIKNAIDSGADKVKVEYDSGSGYPKSIFIDYDERLADEELRLDISNLRLRPQDTHRGT